MRRMSVSEQPVEQKRMAIVATEETEIVAAPPSSSKSMKHPRRPGFGTVGEKCLVSANHFLVEVADNDLNHYDVAISPEVTSRKVCRLIIEQLVDTYKESHLGKLKPAYDGRKSLYTAGVLPFTSQKFKVNFVERDRKEKEYFVTIKHAGRADLFHLRQFLLGQQFDTPQETIQVLDVVLREAPSRNYVAVARSFFSPTFGRSDIGDGLECWRGYYQSLRPTQMGLSLNIDISATSFYNPVPLVQFCAQYLNLRDLSRPLSDIDRIRIKKALKGIRVQVTHRKDCLRRYRITGLSPMPLSQLRFPVDDKGTMMHVTQYFQQKYSWQLKQTSWPCVQTGSDSRPTYLPMEVCIIVEGQRFSKKLNERQVSNILRSTCQRPPQRQQSISEMVKRNNYGNDEYAKEFGIKVNSNLTTVEARVLPPPRLKYHDSGREKTCNPAVGQWNMINKKMVHGGAIPNWACISFSNKLHQNAPGFFCKSLIDVCNKIGMSINPNPIMNIWFERPNNIESALRNLSKQAATQLKGQPLNLLIIILPDITGSYGRIKRVCETELGIVSQCCLPKHVATAKIQYMENVALKINVKVGGTNTVLEDALYKRIPLVTDRPTIIFGADVTHPAPGEDSSSSIAAVVASMDWPQVTKYRGLVSAQPHREEMIKDLFSETADPQRGKVYGGMIRELLMSFRRSIGLKPERIIFYRDGVSEGQFNQVLLYEMDAIRKACQSLEEGYLPPVTFVVVQKRHHTRLFPDKNGRTDRSGNILPGTVVDRKICHPTEFDFYLCSHAGIQGTSRPTHYHVLWDENRFTADQLQMLTNNLCYTYARCTRSVSIVPPAYYAHLAAFRARYYVEGESDAGSTSVGDNTRERTVEVRPLPKIMDSVKNVMFFC